ncbi:MAG: transporter substrate-binding domain-containing protein, partial [Emcibacteraceae bacterium]|nr:transporter substrate-binding domain-containing protein [Emcibacteraceae bacterium]
MTKVRMNKILFLYIAVIALLITGFASPTFAQSENSQIELTQAQKDWISQNPIIRISNPTAIPPFNFTRNGNVEGFVIDYLNLLGSKTRLEFISPEEKPWNEMMVMLQNNEIDLFHSAARSEEREGFLSFSEAYVETPIVNFGRIGAEKITKIEDLIGKKIGVIKGYTTASEYRETYPDFDYVEYDTIRAALQGLSTFEIDVFTGNLTTIKYTALQYFIPNLEVIGENNFLKSAKIIHHFATLHENKILIEILSK